jgi:hypothetical protein
MTQAVSGSRSTARTRARWPHDWHLASVPLRCPSGKVALRVAAAAEEDAPLLAAPLDDLALTALRARHADLVE